MPSLLFRCFLLFLPHLRTLAQEKMSEIVFGLGKRFARAIRVHYRDLEHAYVH